MSAIQTLTQKVNWAPLDVLLLDMPPGTGKFLAYCEPYGLLNYKEMLRSVYYYKISICCGSLRSQDTGYSSTRNLMSDCV